MKKALSKPPVHLICNAHLDPVWKWDWEEGLTEALSTFETAADLLEENEDFIFNHNESVLYEWVLEYRPELFARIKRLVASGRWHISGGWYLQPDCNLPDGESYIRHIVIGRRFFREHFNVAPKLAYNFDPFGHHGNIPQILKKTGYEAYVHFRPAPKELDLPADLYTWEGIDGSQVLAYRPPFYWYGTNDEHELRERIEGSLKGDFGKDMAVGVFWGMGDHGGGATRGDLKVIRALQKGRDNVRHSTTDALLEDLKRDLQEAPPVWKGDLQRVFTGCYTSIVTTKQSNRRSESLVQTAERYATMAWWCSLKPYPEAKLTRIWKDVLFNQFHDILPGTSTRKAMAGTYEIAGRAMKNAREVILDSQLALMASRKRRKPLTIVAFNPLPYATKVPIDFEYMVEHRPILTRYVRSRITDARGLTIASQEEMPAAVSTKFDWRKRVVFEAELPAMGYAEFTIHLDTRKATRRPAALSKPKRTWKWQNAHYQFVLDGGTGLVRSLRRRGGRELLKAPGGSLDVHEDCGDSWGTDILHYDRLIGKFRLATPEEAAEFTGQPHLKGVDPIRVIEEGDVRTVVECLFIFERSTAAIRYTLYKERPEIETDIRVIWNQPRRQLKWSWPTQLRDDSYTVEIPYGSLKREEGHGEQTHLRWLGLTDKQTGEALGISGQGPSGHDVSKGEAKITLLRSAIYLHNMLHPLRERIFHDIMDLGESRFRFCLLATEAGHLDSQMTRLTEHLTFQPGPLAHYPLGASKEDGVRAGQALLSLEGEGVEAGAVKRSEDGHDLVIRLVERTGKNNQGKLKVAGLTGSHRVTFTPYEIKTLRITRKGKIIECDLLEQPLK